MPAGEVNMAYLILAYNEADPEEAPKTYRRDLQSEAAKLVEDINDDPDSGRWAEYREELPDDTRSSMYTALTGKRESPLITILADNVDDARAKITQQLSLPGREEPARMWVEANHMIRTPDGAIAYYWPVLDAMVTKVKGGA